MRKLAFSAVITLSLLVITPFAMAQANGLTMPGSIPTLAPLGIPLTDFGMTKKSTATPTTTPAPTPPVSQKKTTSIGRTVTTYLGRAGAYFLGLIQNLKLDGRVKNIIMDLLRKAFIFLKSYSTQIDPLIRSFLTGASKKLPSSMQKIASSVIPFLTMAATVILGVIVGIICIRIFLWTLEKVILSLFRRKRRRR